MSMAADGTILPNGQELERASVPLNPEWLEKYGEQLDTSEAFWRNHQQWLKASGYILRRRFHDNWVPSWLTDTNKNKVASEDFNTLALGTLADATRESDGHQVMLKRVNLKEHPNELAIASLFSSEPLASNPKNHCIPIYDVLKLPEDTDYAILVMPFLLRFDEPAFVSLGEIVEFLQQILEGLHFMHQRGVAHCDVKINNIMSDTIRLYKAPPHPAIFGTDHTGTRKAKLASNRIEKSVKHYLVDFGLSEMHKPGSSRLTLPGYGGNWRSVPEFQNNSDEPCDPFPVDVYCMGDFIRKRFRKGEELLPAFHGLEFLDGLIADMVQDDPKKRPTMDEVVERFSQVVDSLSRLKLMTRASTVDETTSQRIIKNVRYWIGLA